MDVFLTGFLEILEEGRLKSPDCRAPLQPACACELAVDDLCDPSRSADMHSLAMRDSLNHRQSSIAQHCARDFNPALLAACVCIYRSLEHRTHLTVLRFAGFRAFHLASESPLRATIFDNLQCPSELCRPCLEPDQFTAPCAASPRQPR